MIQKETDLFFFQLLVARKNGKIQFMNPETGHIQKEFTNLFVGPKPEQGKFVGLFIHNK